MANTPTETPALPDIEAAIKEEVAGINSGIGGINSNLNSNLSPKRARPPIQFSTPPSGSTGVSQMPAPSVLKEIAADADREIADALANAQPEPTTLPQILDMLVDRVALFEERITIRLARIERVLGITS